MNIGKIQGPLKIETWATFCRPSQYIHNGTSNFNTELKHYKLLNTFVNENCSHLKRNRSVFVKKALLFRSIFSKTVKLFINC